MARICATGMYTTKGSTEPIDFNITIERDKYTRLSHYLHNAVYKALQESENIYAFEFDLSSMVITFDSENEKEVSHE